MTFITYFSDTGSVSLRSSQYKKKFIKQNFYFFITILENALLVFQLKSYNKPKLLENRNISMN